MSGEELAWGFLLAVAVGVPRGLLIGWIPVLDELFDPLIGFFYATPRIALAPLSVVWFGIGIESKIVVTFLTAVLPIMISVAGGARTIPEDLTRMSKSYGGKRLFIFRTVVVPYSIPTIAAALRVGVGAALLSLVAGEIISSTAGIGYMIQQAGSNFATNQLFVGIIILAFFGLLANFALGQCERWLKRRWDG